VTQTLTDPEQSQSGVRDQAQRLRELVSRTAPEARETPRTDHAPPKRRAPVIAVASGKGGVGKTSTCVNLAIALARRNRRVCLLDADLGCANADVLCGLMPTSRLDNGSDAPSSLRDLIVEAPGGFGLIPGSVGIGHAGELSDHDRRALMRRIDDLHDACDAVMIDTSAGLGASVTSFVEHADKGLVVLTPEPTSVADAYALIKVLVTRAYDEDRINTLDLALVLNQVANEREAIKVYERMRGVCERFLDINIPMLGYLRADKRVPKAVKARSPYMLRSPRAPVARDMMTLAQSLVEWAHIEPRMSFITRREP
jgi:flagellar biosynthesis protein FlhG